MKSLIASHIRYYIECMYRECKVASRLHIVYCIQTPVSKWQTTSYSYGYFLREMRRCAISPSRLFPAVGVRHNQRTVGVLPVVPDQD